MAKKIKLKSNSQKSKKRRIIDTVAILCLACIVIASIAGFLVLNKILDERQPFQQQLLEGATPTVILASNGEVAMELSNGDGIRENITYDQVPQVVIDAFLAVEDSRFFKHNGFDLPRFLKSFLENIKQGGFAQGGSTLTMQMIDVSHTTTTPYQNTIQKLIAKVEEIFLALDAESYLSKEEILMKYLNLINFGGPARGIQKGAQYYFGKDISEVTLSEAAFLAGVINAPNAYNPYLNYENAVARRNTALALMKQHGYISEEEYQLALNTKLAFQLNGTTTFDGLPLQSFIDYLDQYCREKLNINIYEGNMTIYTTMDLEVQQMYDAIMNGEYGILPENYPLLQLGSAVVRVEDGSVAAIGGGRNYTGNDRKNFGFGVERQTGSSIKPLLDYTLAFEYLGWATDQIIADIPMNYRGTELSLHNADNKFRGDVNIADAISYSWNIPAITALQDVADTIGIQKIIDTMKKLGFAVFQDMKTDQFEFTMGIGGGSMATTPLEMASAYQTLANGGVHIEPYPVTRIDFADETKEDYVHEPVSTQVFSPQASYLMNNLLVKAVSDYSGNFQSIMKSNYQVATKTGTSDWGDLGLQHGIPETAAKDSWMVSYTTKYVVASWTGFYSGQDGYLTGDLIFKNTCGNLNRKIFDKVHSNNRPSDFAQPSGVVSITHLKGLFDKGHYAVPDGTPSNLITTGLVKSEFATLKTLNSDEISELKSFSASVNENTKYIDFSFAAYPDAEALKPFDGKYHGVPDDPKFEGTKIFHKSLVFGPIVYKVEAFQGGASLGAFTYSTETGSDKLNITPGIEAKVCGYYAYSNNNSKSNEICVTLSAEETAKMADTNPNHPDNPENPTDPTDD